MLAMVWLFGVITQFIPVAFTSGIIRGNRCAKALLWPSFVLLYAYSITTIILQYFVPLAMLFFAYIRVYLYIRKVNLSVISQPHQPQHKHTNLHDVNIQCQGHIDQIKRYV